MGQDERLKNRIKKFRNYVDHDREVAVILFILFFLSKLFPGGHQSC